MNTFDALTLASYILEIANYRENLSQSDKDDILKMLDDRSKTILVEIKNELTEQNYMLKEIKAQNNTIIERLSNNEN